MPKIKTIIETVQSIEVEDYIKSKLKSPLTPNIIHARDIDLTQKFLQNIDHSKYIIFS